MTQPARLLLDEMFAAQIAAELRGRGYDVLALVADPDLRALTDPQVYEWATNRGRRVVTENVQDFRPLVAAGAGPGVLFTSSRTFPRSRRNPGPLLDALEQWLVASTALRPVEDWLVRARP